jgi:hypothetical protein
MSVPDYVFREGLLVLPNSDPEDFRNVRLADLFTDGHDTLLVDHLMFAAQDEEPCVMCSMWADGYNAVAPHIMQRASFVLVAKAEISNCAALHGSAAGTASACSPATTPPSIAILAWRTRTAPRILV